MMLDWLIQAADQESDRWPRYKRGYSEALSELQGRRDPAPLPRLPRNSSEAVPLVREHFRDDVTRASLVLHRHFPKEYLFYRVSKLEEEVFEGLHFLAETVPEFAFGFDRVGRTGFGRYLELNRALLGFARAHWSRARDPQGRLLYFLYEGLGRLFLEKSEYNRYWIMATKSEYWPDLNGGKKIDWSGRKDMRAGDLVFMYRTSPRKAITNIYRVLEGPRFDPWGAWEGFWADLAPVCDVPDITFAQMRADPVLGEWWVVRKQLTGTVCDPVPHSVYNRFLELLPESLRQQHGLVPEELAPSCSSGHYDSERHFETEVIEPLLERWVFQYQRQYPCRFCVGSQYVPARVDYLVSDEHGPLTVFEDKLRIVTDRHLQPAVDQAKSYALMLGLPSFVVASPEAIRVYSLERQQERLAMEVATEELARESEALRALLLRLRA